MQLVNLTLDIYNVVIGFIILGAIFTSHIMDNNEPVLKKVRQWYNRIAVINMLMAAVDIFTILCAGPSHPANFIIHPIAMFIYYSLAFLLLPASGICILYLLDRYKPLEKGKKGIMAVVIASTVVYFILLAITPFKGLLYVIDENNNYSHGQYFNLAFIIQGIMYLSLLIYMLVNRKDIGKLKVMIVVSFILVPQIAQVLQLAFNGIALVNTGYSLIFIIMFIFSNNVAEHELKNAESRIDEIVSEVNNKSSEIERSKLKIIKMQDHTIESLSNLVENRDEDTGEHVLRTREYVELIAVQMMKDGYYPEILTPRYIRLLKRAAPMHDIGKIVVPDAILKKADRFTPEEYALMKRHASEGGRIVHQILDGYETPEYIQITADIATHHHEKWDGTGYPDNLAGKQIPFSARIMAIADVFDALVSPRVYKSPMSYEEAFSLIEEGIGTQFDPIVAQEFLKIREKATAINERYKLVK